MAWQDPAFCLTTQNNIRPLISTLFTPLLPVPQVEAVLQGLDRRRSYFSVVQFAGLIREEQLAIPCDLKLTLFVGGGTEDLQQAPQLSLLPIPLLLKVGTNGFAVSWDLKVLEVI